MTKTASEGAEPCDSYISVQAKQKSYRERNPRDRKIIKIVKGSSFRQDLVISGEKWSSIQS